MGCSSLASVVVIDQDYYGKVKPTDIEKILSAYE
jgi:NADH:ubiquinone oxidoreductase subunit E